MPLYLFVIFCPLGFPAMDVVYFVMDKIIRVKVGENAHQCPFLPISKTKLSYVDTGIYTLYVKPIRRSNGILKMSQIVDLHFRLWHLAYLPEREKTHLSDYRKKSLEWM